MTDIESVEYSEIFTVGVIIVILQGYPSAFAVVGLIVNKKVTILKMRKKLNIFDVTQLYIYLDFIRKFVFIQ